MRFPSTFSSFNRPNPTDRLNSPSHSALHNTVSSALGQVEAVIGLADSGSVAGTLMYDLRSSASDGGGHIQSANKGGTGQTNYAKGDILIAQSSSVLGKLAVSATNGQALIADNTQSLGVRWGQPGGSPTVRVYPNPSLLTGTGGASLVAIWSKPSNLSYIVVEVIGGGGSGGAGNGSNSRGGPGGGGGGYARRLVAAASVPTTVQVIIGKGGTSSSGGAGGTGGTSEFGSLLTASGGIGGTGANASSGGRGGFGNGGDVNLPGQGGGAGMLIASSGCGGNSFFGGGARGVAGADLTGADGEWPGGGGSGGVRATADREGGIGQNGGIVVYEY